MEEGPASKHMYCFPTPMQLACSIELVMDTSLVHCIPPTQIAFICKASLRSTSRQLLCSVYSLPDNPWPLIGRRARPWLIVTEEGGVTEQ
jgi:hypothetical protein